MTVVRGVATPAAVTAMGAARKLEARVAADSLPARSTVAEECVVNTPAAAGAHVMVSVCPCLVNGLFSEAKTSAEA